MTNSHSLAMHYPKVGPPHLREMIRNWRKGYPSDLARSLGDLIDNTIQLLSQNNNEVISCSSEEMYIDELRDLHYSISNNTIPLSNVDTALETQNIIESMKQSLLEKSICPIN